MAFHRFHLFLVISDLATFTVIFKNVFLQTYFLLHTMKTQYNFQHLRQFTGFFFFFFLALASAMGLNHIKGALSVSKSRAQHAALFLPRSAQ